MFSHFATKSEKYYNFTHFPSLTWKIQENLEGRGWVQGMQGGGGGGDEGSQNEIFLKIPQAESTGLF